MQNYLGIFLTFQLTKVLGRPKNIQFDELKRNTLKENSMINSTLEVSFPPLSERIKLISPIKRKLFDVIYLIMYDIENNKVRKEIADYLIKIGCKRIQLSVYMHKSNRQKYNNLKSTLAEIQSLYDNFDSIILVPIGENTIEKITIIGKEINVETLICPPSTLFI